MLQYIYYFNKILCHYMYSHRILFVHPYHIDNIVKCSIQCNVQRDIRIPRWSYVCVVSVNHTFNKSVFMNSREIPCLEWNICSVSVISDGKKNLKKTPKKKRYILISELLDNFWIITWWSVADILTLVVTYLLLWVI